MSLVSGVGPEKPELIDCVEGCAYSDLCKLRLFVIKQPGTGSAPGGIPDGTADFFSWMPAAGRSEPYSFRKDLPIHMVLMDADPGSF